jgi:uncharacterized protein (DUF58 family)
VRLETNESRRSHFLAVGLGIGLVLILAYFLGWQVGVAFIFLVSGSFLRSSTISTHARRRATPPTSTARFWSKKAELPKGPQPSLGRRDFKRARLQDAVGAFPADTIPGEVSK